MESPNHTFGLPTLCVKTEEASLLFTHIMLMLCLLLELIVEVFELNQLPSPTVRSNNPTENKNTRVFEEFAGSYLDAISREIKKLYYTITSRHRGYDKILCNRLQIMDQGFLWFPIPPF